MLLPGIPATLHHTPLTPARTPLGFQNSAMTSDLPFRARGFVVVDQPAEDRSTPDPPRTGSGIGDSGWVDVAALLDADAACCSARCTSRGRCAGVVHPLTAQISPHSSPAVV